MGAACAEESASGVGTGTLAALSENYDTEGVKVELQHVLWSTDRT